MLYKFKSKAAGDVIMLGPNGDEMLRLLGREPAPKGILEPAHMPAALAALEAAVARAEAPPEAGAAAGGRDTGAADAQDDDPRPRVGLRQRVWPFVEQVKRSMDAGVPIVWGV